MRGFVGVYAFAVVVWLQIARGEARGAFRGSGQAAARRSFFTAAVLAIVLRLLVVWPAPLLSGDVYRYLSDGRMLASGVNPYSYTPTDPRINHPEIRSIYPPHAQLLFALVHELRSWRALIIAFDLLAIFLLREHRFSYATCPLVIFEGTWSGHLDAIAAVFLLIAMTRRSGAALAFAGGLKVIPLAALPALARGSRWKNVLAFVATLALPFLPFLGKPIMPGLHEYATRWIFNAPGYDLVRAIVEQVPTKAIWTHHPLRFAWLSDFVYRHLHADFVTRAVLGVIAVGGMLLARRVTTAVAVLLLCSPAIHPWYWLTLVPSALLERSRWLSVALCAPASYLLYEHAPPLAVFAICYCVPAFACVASRFSSSLSRSST